MLGLDTLRGGGSLEIIYLGAEGNNLLILGTWYLSLPSFLQSVILVSCASYQVVRFVHHLLFKTVLFESDVCVEYYVWVCQVRWEDLV